MVKKKRTRYEDAWNEQIHEYEYTGSELTRKQDWEGKEDTWTLKFYHSSSIIHEAKKILARASATPAC